MLQRGFYSPRSELRLSPRLRSSSSPAGRSGTPQIASGAFGYARGGLAAGLSLAPREGSVLSLLSPLASVRAAGGDAGDPLGISFGPRRGSFRATSGCPPPQCTPVGPVEPEFESGLNAQRRSGLSDTGGGGGDVCGSGGCRSPVLPGATSYGHINLFGDLCIPLTAPTLTGAGRQTVSRTPLRPEFSPSSGRVCPAGTPCASRTRCHTTNHHQRPRTTVNCHEPPQNSINQHKPS